MANEYFAFKAVYCGFISVLHEPTNSDEVHDYLVNRVRSKPMAPALIEGDLTKFTVTTKRTRIIPANLITGYIALDNAMNSVAVLMADYNHHPPGYRMFAFESLVQQDAFVAYLDKILDLTIAFLRSQPDVVHEKVTMEKLRIEEGNCQQSEVREKAEPGGIIGEIPRVRPRLAVCQPKHRRHSRRSIASSISQLDLYHSRDRPPGQTVYYYWTP
ncbi:unnamed protein product [Schistocephalus solidus]|uniref:WS_DGAT_C domain-containing protein n=1 Tax=Schistocephalus solidus TaxID=70667 RepID=A0A0X3QC03_SCHSO|nr:unnamed protein product [Schistocephalus solidus]